MRTRQKCVATDTEMCLDTVWRTGLRKKLLDSHINGKCFNFIVNMYNNIKSRVTTNTGSSEFFSCNVGVRRGENLSPFLFSIFLNDLQDYLIVRQASGVDIDVSTEDASYYMKMLILLYADEPLFLVTILTISSMH